MKKSVNSEEDILGRYFYPGKIEKAPEGFTRRVMENIKFEQAHPVRVPGFLRRQRVPLISAGLTLILVLTVFLLPDTSFGSFPLSGLADKIKFPEINVSPDVLKQVTLPHRIPYIFIGIFLLLVFDWSVSGLFRKENKTGNT